jgi:hypothetical protein
MLDKMVVAVIMLILVVGQASAGSMRYQASYPRYRGDDSAVNFGAYEASAAEAVVVEASNNNRHPKQLGIIFAPSLPAGGDSSYHGDNIDCKGYSMLGCV